MRYLDYGCACVLLVLASLKAGIVADHVKFIGSRFGGSAVVDISAPETESRLPDLENRTFAGVPETGPREGLLGLLTIAVGLVEAALGISFLVGRTPRISAGGLVALGLVLASWTVIQGPGSSADGSCGCFGPLALEFMDHVSVSGALVFLGGIQCILVARPKTRSIEGTWEPPRRASC